MKKRFAVGMNGQTGGFEVHSAGCKDLKNPRKVSDFTGPAWPAVGADGQAVLDSELAEDFDGRSYREAGFAGRVFPCCEKARPA